MKQASDLRNVDTAIVAVAQLIQPCQLDALIAQAKAVLRESTLDKRQIRSRINLLETSGYLWSRSDKLILVTPKGYVLSKASIAPEERDKFRLLLLNKSRYK